MPGRVARSARPVASRQAARSPRRRSRRVRWRSSLEHAVDRLQRHLGGVERGAGLAAMQAGQVGDQDQRGVRVAARALERAQCGLGLARVAARDDELAAGRVADRRRPVRARRGARRPAWRAAPRRRAKRCPARSGRPRGPACRSRRRSARARSRGMLEHELERRRGRNPASSAGRSRAPARRPPATAYTQPSGRPAVDAARPPRAAIAPTATPARSASPPRRAAGVAHEHGPGAPARANRADEVAQRARARAAAEAAHGQHCRAPPRLARGSRSRSRVGRGPGRDPRFGLAGRRPVDDSQATRTRRRRRVVATRAACDLVVVHDAASAPGRVARCRSSRCARVPRRASVGDRRPHVAVVLGDLGVADRDLGRVGRERPVLGRPDPQRDLAVAAGAVEPQHLRVAALDRLQPLQLRGLLVREPERCRG